MMMHDKNFEKAFAIKFSSREILSWDNVGDLVDCIAKKV